MGGGRFQKYSAGTESTFLGGTEAFLCILQVPNCSVHLRTIGTVNTSLKSNIYSILKGFVIFYKNIRACHLVLILFVRLWILIKAAEILLRIVDNSFNNFIDLLQLYLFRCYVCANHTAFNTVHLSGCNCRKVPQ